MSEIRSVAASLAVMLWCVAAGALLLPVSRPFDPSSTVHSCGMPAFYSHGPFVSSLTKGGNGLDSSAADEIAGQCEGDVNGRFRLAVDVMLVSLPALAAWCLIKRREDSDIAAPAPAEDAS
jgi:hypothetical protein